MTDQSSLARKIVKGMFVVLFFWLFWKFGGFLLGVIIGNLYPPGKEPAADAYAHVYKYVVFTFIYSTALKLLIPAFVPVFIEKMKQDGEANAWEFAYSIVNIILIAAIVVSAIGVFAAPHAINLLVPGFSPRTQELCIRLLRIMLPGCVGMVMSMVMMSLLNSYKVFSYPAAGDAAQKLVWAAALFLGVTLLGLSALTIGYGFLAGCVVQVLINCFGLRKKRRFYRPLVTVPRMPRFLRELGFLAYFGVAFLAVAYGSNELEKSLGFVMAVAGAVAPGAARIDIAMWARMFVFTAGLVLACGYSAFLWARARRKTSAAARFAALIAPLVIGVAFARYRDVVTSLFQSFTKSGVFADVEFSKNIGNFPIVLVAYGLSVAMFPYLCELASGKDLKTFATLVTRALRMIALFFIPVSIAMILLNKPIIALVYDRGNWSNLHIGYAGTALSLYVYALFFYAIENVVMQSYFSVQRMWMPTFLGIVASLLQVTFLFLGIRVLRYDHPQDIFLAVAIAYPLSRIFKNIALLAILRLHVPILPFRETAAFVAKLAVVCVAFGAVVYGTGLTLEARFPVEKFKKTDILLDTFNAENRTWTSRDAEDLKIQETDARGPVLAFTYRPLSTREVSIDQELDRFRLDDVTRVNFTCRASKPQNLIAELFFAETTWRSDPVSIATQWPEQPYTLVVPPGRGRARRISLVIPKDREVSPGGFLSPRPEVEPGTLWLKELSITCSGREIMIDTFAQPSPEWQGTPQPLVVAETGEDDGRERALVLVDSITGGSASRNLAGYDLRDTAGIRFKVKADAPQRLDVTLVDSAGTRFRKTLQISPSETRKTYSIAFAEFAGTVRPSDLDRVHFSFSPLHTMAIRERIMLDNLTFTAPRGLLGGISLQYEIVKLLHVGAPCLLGGIVLIVLVFLLRIEEGRLVLNWVLEQGRARFGRPVRRGRAQ